MSFLLKLKDLLDPKILRAITIPVFVVGVPLIVLLVLQSRALGRFEKSAAQDLRQTGIVLANNLAEKVQHDYRSSFFSVMEGLDPDTIRSFALDRVHASLVEKTEATRLLDRFFVWTRSPPPTEGSREGEPPMAFLSLARRDARWARLISIAPKVDHGPRGFFRDPDLARFILDEVEALGDTGGSYGFSLGTIRGERQHVVVRSLQDADQPRIPSAAYGFTVNPAHLASQYFPHAVSRIKAAHEEAFGSSSLEICIVDDAGNEVYRTGPPLGNNVVHEERFPFVFLDPAIMGTVVSNPPDVPHWRVQTGYPGTTVEDLVHSRTNHQRQLLILLTLVAGVGVLLAARATAREVRLGEMQSEFVSSVSHDLKTPLATIQMFAETLESKRARSADKVREYGRLIDREAKKLGELIDDILEFGKIDEGSRQYSMEEIDLREVVRESVDSFSHTLQEARFDTEVELPPEEVPFYGNREGLLQVFKNLVSNAIKYSEEERHLAVELQVSDSNAVVEVRDRGVGIPARDQTMIFKKFYRVRNDPDTDAAGTGLGLAIAEHIVQSHGGRINVESRDGRGSSFRVELPLWFRG